MAFNLLSDEEGTISYFEVFNKIENYHKRDEEETLVVSILKRIGNFEEIWGDRRVNFDEFFALMKRAMAMRQTKNQVNTLYKLFDPNGATVITGAHLKKISRDIGCELSSF